MIFSERDHIVISKTLSQKLFGDESSMGKEMMERMTGPTGPTISM